MCKGGASQVAFMLYTALAASKVQNKCGDGEAYIGNIRYDDTNRCSEQRVTGDGT